MHPPRDPARVASFLLHHPAVVALGVAAAAEGVDVQLVGGALRDRLLGLPSADLDATLADRGRAVAQRLARALGARFVELGGKEFGAFRLVGPDYVLDLWDREGGSLDADLLRRDLTVNAIALTVPGGQLIDPTGGLVDLSRRRLRAVRTDSFRSDPLRVLRLPRFWVQLPGFAVEPATLTLAHASAPEIAAVAAERVRDELDKIFRHPEAHRALALLATLDLYPGLWLGRPGEAGATGDAVLHLARLAPRALELRQRAPAVVLPHLTVDHRLARWATTFAGLAGDHLERFSRAGFLDKRDRAAVAALLADDELPRDERARRRFLHRHGPLWPTVVALLGARAPAAEEDWRRQTEALFELFGRVGPEIYDPPRLLDGHEVADLLGLAKGPALGEALARLREAQVEGRVGSEAEAREFLKGREGGKT
jgi:tRNA nucleotidyltransferase/poly(A) polymerase